MAMNLEINFFWDVMPCSMSTFYKNLLRLSYTEAGGSWFL